MEKSATNNSINPKNQESCENQKQEMFGDIKESEDVYKKRYSFQTSEKYETSLTGHYLILELHAKDNITGETLKVTDYKHKLPKDVPKWLTTNNLWHHTQGELEQLQQLTKQNKERKPSKKTLNQWKELLEADKRKRNKHVLQTDNNKKSL